jgi:hypothetical protein
VTGECYQIQYSSARAQRRQNGGLSESELANAVAGLLDFQKTTPALRNLVPWLAGERLLSFARLNLLALDPPAGALPIRF